MAPRPTTPDTLSTSLRIALLVNPFTLSVRGGDHAPQLARELLGLGHTVRGFGAPPGAIPRSGADLAPDEGESDDEGLLGWAPDAVIAYDALSPAAWLGARTVRRLGVPLVLVESGARRDEHFGSRVLRRLGQLLYGRYVRSTADALVALDAHARDRAIARGFDSAQIDVLPPGVDLGVYRPGLASGLIQRHHVRGRMLLFVGEIAENRGLDILVSAFAQTVGQRADWSLVFAGDGPARPTLRALVDRQGIAARVHWLARPREEELPGLISASTLFAVPAQDGSIRGRQIPRAMACGVPVVASDLPALRRYVEPDGTGLLVEAGSLRAWTDALRRASISPDARKRWGLRARAVAEEKLGWSRIARSFEQILLEARGSVAVRAAQVSSALIEEGGPGAGGAA
jgi:glycosyltransferase involved in cell wall biosynthesis